MRSAGIAPSNTLNFAITRDRVSSTEHAPPHIPSSYGRSPRFAMPQRLKNETWAELKRLFMVGWSIGRLSKRFGVPKGSLAARSAKEKWMLGRVKGQTMDPNEVTLSDDPHLAAVQELVNRCKLETLASEARTARTLAAKAAKAAESIEINDLAGIAQAQAYRDHLWPSASPSIMPALEAARRGERLVVSPETKQYVESLKQLM
jgi:hypothetical protein